MIIFQNLYNVIFIIIYLLHVLVATDPNIYTELKITFVHKVYLLPDFQINAVYPLKKSIPFKNTAVFYTQWKLM